MRAWPLLLMLWLLPVEAAAWGRDGHRAIGAIALDHLSDTSLTNLQAVLGTQERETIVEWCIWPDAYRSTDEGAWTAPMHFVNIPEGSDHYDRARDCAGDLCVTEAIGRYAAELGNRNLASQQRREAFGFVCHFVGDLSQPLHAGFASDRGGNNFSIEFNGQGGNLHAFWDFGLIEVRMPGWQPLHRLLAKRFPVIPWKRWSPRMSVRWTNRSHRIAAERVYPGGPLISPQFADESWVLMQQQLARGGRNLATVLNTVLEPR